jgi:hypothetical protein
VGPEMDPAQREAKAAHLALLSRDETSRHGVRSAARRHVTVFVTESMVFDGGVALWRVIQDGETGLQGGESTGPEMDPKKIDLWTGEFCSATSQGSRLRVAPKSSSSSAPVAGAPLPSAGSLERAVRQTARSVSSSPISCWGSVADRSPRCGCGFPVRVRLLRGVGVCSWGANQQRDGADGQSQLRNNCSLTPNSVDVSSSWLAALSRRSGSQPACACTAANARNGTPTSSSKVSASPAHARRSRFTPPCSIELPRGGPSSSPSSALSIVSSRGTRISISSRSAA